MWTPLPLPLTHFRFSTTSQPLIKSKYKRIQKVQIHSHQFSTTSQPRIRTKFKRFKYTVSKPTASMITISFQSHLVLALPAYLTSQPKRSESRDRKEVCFGASNSPEGKSTLQLGRKRVKRNLKIQTTLWQGRGGKTEKRTERCLVGFMISSVV